MDRDWIWITAIVCTGIWSLQAIVSKIVDGVVKTKQARMDLERDYLTQMVADLEEIKARLDQREQTREGAGY